MIDFDWLHAQLRGVKPRLTPEEIRAVKELATAWNRVEPTDRVIQIFNAVAQGHAVAAPDQEAQWLDGSSRTPGVGQTVRVPPDKFTGGRGETLNGRVGRVVAVRYGDVIVNFSSEGGEAYEGVHFRPHELETKIN